MCKGHILFVVNVDEIGTNLHPTLSTTPSPLDIFKIKLALPVPLMLLISLYQLCISLTRGLLTMSTYNINHKPGNEVVR